MEKVELTDEQFFQTGNNGILGMAFEKIDMIHVDQQ